MSVRTSRRVVTFKRAFAIAGVEGVHSPGSYTVETDEEQLDTASVTAYRRVATRIRLPLPNGGIGSSQNVEVDPAALEAALAQDGAPEGDTVS